MATLKEDGQELRGALRQAFGKFIDSRKEAIKQSIVNVTSATKEVIDEKKAQVKTISKDIARPFQNGATKTAKFIGAQYARTVDGVDKAKESVINKYNEAQKTANHVRWVSRNEIRSFKEGAKSFVKDIPLRTATSIGAAVAYVTNDIKIVKDGIVRDYNSVKQGAGKVITTSGNAFVKGKEFVKGKAIGAKNSIVKSYGDATKKAAHVRWVSRDKARSFKDKVTAVYNKVKNLFSSKYKETKNSIVKKYASAQLTISYAKLVAKDKAEAFKASAKAFPSNAAKSIGRGIAIAGAGLKLGKGMIVKDFKEIGREIAGDARAVKDGVVSAKNSIVKAYGNTTKKAAQAKQVAINKAKEFKEDVKTFPNKLKTGFLNKVSNLKDSVVKKYASAQVTASYAKLVAKDKAEAFKASAKAFPSKAVKSIGQKTAQASAFLKETKDNAVQGVISAKEFVYDGVQATKDGIKDGVNSAKEFVGNTKVKAKAFRDSAKRTVAGSGFAKTVKTSIAQGKAIKNGAVRLVGEGQKAYQSEKIRLNQQQGRQFATSR